jgi:hypothetical protein
LHFAFEPDWPIVKTVGQSGNTSLWLAGLIIAFLQTNIHHYAPRMIRFIRGFCFCALFICSFSLRIF